MEDCLHSTSFAPKSEAIAPMSANQEIGIRTSNDGDGPQIAQSGLGGRIFPDCAANSTRRISTKLINFDRVNRLVLEDIFLS